MPRIPTSRWTGASVVYVMCVLVAIAQEPKPTGQPQDKLAGRAEMEVLNGKAEIVSYRGHRAVHLIPSPDHQGPETRFSPSSVTLNSVTE